MKKDEEGGSGEWAVCSGQFAVCSGEFAVCSKIKNNIFNNNTAAIFMDGTSKVDLYNNQFSNNGWGIKLNANCM